MLYNSATTAPHADDVMTAQSCMHLCQDATDANVPSKTHAKGAARNGLARCHQTALGHCSPSSVDAPLTICCFMLLRQPYVGTQVVAHCQCMMLTLYTENREDNQSTLHLPRG
jgi:hypothetical protein